MIIFSILKSNQSINNRLFCPSTIRLDTRFSRPLKDVWPLPEALRGLPDLPETPVFELSSAGLSSTPAAPSVDVDAPLPEVQEVRAAVGADLHPDGGLGQLVAVHRRAEAEERRRLRGVGHHG